MIKKIAIATAIILSVASTAEITDSKFKYSPDLEYKNYQEKIYHVKLGDVRKDFIKEINYIGEKWYLIEQKGHWSYYVQKDPLSDKISRVRIVYPYSDFETGRDLKHLSEFITMTVPERSRHCRQQQVVVVRIYCVLA